MKRFLLYILFLVLAVILGLKIQHDPGYALFAYGQWTVEMPLWFGFILFFTVIIIIIAIYQIIYSSINTTQHFHYWWKKRRHHIAQRKINKGLIELTFGHWQLAEKYLMNSAKFSTIPVVNYLAAARAAHELRAYDRRDEYLRLAHGVSKKADIAVSLMQAQLQLNHHQYEQALATLNRLYQLIPEHTYVLRLLMQLYLQLKEWEKLMELLPKLRKAKVCKEQELFTLEKEIYREVLLKYANTPQLEHYWQMLPKALKQDAEVVLIYAEQLIHNQAWSQAEKLLQDTLKKHYDDQLILLYANLHGGNPTQRLALAEQWLKSQPQNPQLLLALGMIANAAKLWGKAKHYFEQSAALAANPQIFAALGQWYETQGQPEQAFHYYRQAVEYTCRQ
ncbi:MAG: hypothetical protein KIT27_07015 [Legionellales bacterium]|nr:hypothetical protein [Legionellales bacterium]